MDTRGGRSSWVTKRKASARARSRSSLEVKSVTTTIHCEGSSPDFEEKRTPPVCQNPPPRYTSLSSGSSTWLSRSCRLLQFGWPSKLPNVKRLISGLHPCLRQKASQKRL